MNRISNTERNVKVFRGALHGARIGLASAALFASIGVKMSNETNAVVYLLAPMLKKRPVSIVEGIIMPGQAEVVRKLIAILSVAAFAALCVSTSADAGPGGICGRTRHRLAGHCVSALVGHSARPADRMA